MMFELLKVYKETVVAYAILDNHYHFMIQVGNPESVSKMMKSFGLRSAKYYNKKYNSVGHLFQGKYQTKIVETSIYELYLSKYIHMNPLKVSYANSFEELLSYRWSSLRYYINDEINLEDEIKDVFKPDLILQYFRDKQAYKEYLLKDTLWEEVDLLNKPRKEVETEIRSLLMKHIEFFDVDIGSD